MDKGCFPLQQKGKQDVFMHSFGDRLTWFKSPPRRRNNADERSLNILEQMLYRLLKKILNSFEPSSQCQSVSCFVCSNLTYLNEKENKLSQLRTLIHELHDKIS